MVVPQLPGCNDLGDHWHEKQESGGCDVVCCIFSICELDILQYGLVWSSQSKKVGR